MTSKYCVCTLYDGTFYGFAPLVLRSLEQFAEVNSFDLVYYDKLLNFVRHPAWNKCYAILDCFDKGYEWVLWSDADSIYINRNKFLEACPPEYSSFWTSIDENGICTSHIFIKNTDYNRGLLRAMLLLGDVKDDGAFGVCTCKWEQNALKALRLHFHINLTYFPQSLVVHNSLPVQNNTQFVHFPSKSIEERLRLITTTYNKFYPI